MRLTKAFARVICSGIWLLSAIGDQGTISFSNYIPGYLDYPVSNCDGPLAGEQWSAQLWGGPLGTPESMFVPFYPVTTFRTDLPGYWVPVGIATGFYSVSAQIRVWNNENGVITNFLRATIRGVSPIVDISELGGYGLPPTTPADLTMFNNVKRFVVDTSNCTVPTNTFSYGVEFSSTNLVASEFKRTIYLNVTRSLLNDAGGIPTTNDTAHLRFEDGTARAGQDYQANLGSIIFQSPTSALVPINVSDDPVWHPPRTFTVRLADPADKVIVGPKSSLTVTIMDEDTIVAPARRIDGDVQLLLAVPDNKWMIGGNFTDVDGYVRIGIARLNSDASIDPDFDPGLGANGPLSTIVQQTDRKLIVGGAFSSFSGSPRTMIARLLENGQLDQDFLPAIRAASSFVPGVQSAIGQALLQPDGKILTAGSGLVGGTTTNAGLLRLNADGFLDETFIPPTTLTNASVIAIQPDGKVLVGRPLQNSLIRLSSNGNLDLTFVADLTLIHSRAIRDVFAMSLLTNGNILVGGLPLFSEKDLGLLVLNPSGNPATQTVSLQVDGKSVVHGVALCITRDRTGNFYVGGWWELLMDNGAYGGGFALFRLNPDLSQDTNFFSGFGGGRTRTLAVQSDGRIAGNGSTRIGPGRIGLLYPNGHLVSDLKIAGVGIAPDGQLHLALSGYAPFINLIQSSSDLRNWNTLTNANGQTANMIFKGAVNRNLGPTFYRAVSTQ